MALVFRYKPPTVNAAVALAAAVPAATHAIAEAILADSQPLVPVESGALKASGKVTQEGSKATVSYDVVSDEDGYPYGIRQHEDLALHHPNGGQAHFLSQPMSSDPAGRVLIAATILREALEL